MITLLIKDFKLLFRREKSLTKRILSTLLSMIFIGSFVAIEIILFSAILDKIKDFSQAPAAFMTLFLLVISVLLTVFLIFQAKKLFFNEKDIEQLSSYPIGNSQMVLSKLLLLFLVHYATSILFIYPLFIAYGSMFREGIMFYYKALFYPVASFLFEGGLALLLVYPVRLFLQFLKKYLLLEFILAGALLFALTFLYSKVLDVFINLVANNDVTSLFTSASIAKFTVFQKRAVPITFLVDTFVLGIGNKLFPYMCIAGGFFALGLAITIFAFNYVRNTPAQIKRKSKQFHYKQVSPIKALMRKEFILIAKDSDYIFSFTGLLLVQPFLLYLVLSVFNTIFNAGAFLYYVKMLPNFIPLVDMLVIMMFTLSINQGANQYITMEKGTIKNIKTLPIDYKKQLLVKVLIPFTLSFASMSISLLVAWIGGLLSARTFLASFLLTGVALAVFELVSLREELHIRHGKPRSSYRSSMYSYVLPLGFVAIGILLSYFKVEILTVYASGLAVFIVVGLIELLYLRKNARNLFMDLEAEH